MRAAALWATAPARAAGPAGCDRTRGRAPAAATSRASSGRPGRRPPDRPCPDGPREAAALPDGSSFLDRALQRHVRFPTLYRAYCRHLGAQGFGRVTELLTAAADRADSAAERLLTGLLRRHGITG